ncbi:alpha/beta hydrolase fold protein [Natrialba magadii ATCC 43099]|uniref:Alpha/beta hydrolase fold protein n=1 Tax=Natrialba magadii (strain ATCC 43099 / DSM 3394 / CCM 3739 / CIP 104546 / IAM 13178 / JCM 8861 / NBRC 102185 / NCIMB 2190 / MS3) TaxID=547559 RepID=D3SQP8_NATMM|nr:alpha/beta hydrolase [Natrialba magadii]ADD04536.1 alpha/beta hydrolase fold protein [Natrialba magadii ATCC 43099]ELY25193.1 alpha/beta hydrolase fold-3 protein domain-containing protein [Natrialba magadii ATCC 43099]
MRAAEPHPDAQAVLDLYNSFDAPSFTEVSVETARQLMAELRDVEPAIELESVSDRTIDGPDGEVPIRVYEPRPAGERGDQPLVLYFHGGGWVIGSIDTHDGTCRKLASESGYPVISVDYRLAPEHPFPAGLQDCYAVLEWAADAAPGLDADPDRLVLAGDSAGGNLAAATALYSRDQDGPAIAYQLLLYPVTGPVEGTDAYEENAEGYILTTDEMDWFEGHYFDRELDRGNIYAMPRLANDLSGLPPATVVTAGFDPLRDDGAAYADRLDDAGVETVHRNYDDLIHGFFGMTREPMEIERTHDVYDDVIGDLRAELGS